MGLERKNFDETYKLVSEIRKLTKEFPAEESEGLAKQMVIAAESIAAIKNCHNQPRAKSKEYLPTAHNALWYLKTQYQLAVDLRYIKRNEIVENLLNEVSDMFCQIPESATLLAIKTD